MNVTIGQVWEDRDLRRKGRQFKVERIVAGKAVCRVIQAGSAKGKSPVRIRLDRFVPKYYQNVSSPIPNAQGKLPFWSPPSVKSSSTDSLESRCAKLLNGNWDCPSKRYAQMRQGPIKILVREVTQDVYDVKIRFDQCLMSSFVVRDSLEHTVEQIRDYLTDIRENLDETLSDNT